MKISYAITVCNEFLEIQKLIPFLLENKRQQDEIVVLYDQKNGSSEVLNYLLKFNKLPNVQTWRGFEFENDFAQWKNLLTTYCSGDFIFQIDADEIPNLKLIKALPEILSTNKADIMLVPRVNTVKGLTQDYISKWGWNVKENGWVNFPDYQWRIYKNSKEIVWKNKVHEVLDGFKTFLKLPASEDYSLYHPKTLKKQIKQNDYYDTL